jgi:uncharacterized protein YndB with AHSA1/START domain
MAGWHVFFNSCSSLYATKPDTMKTEDLIATAQTTIDVPKEKVWDALVTPATIKKYMFGATVVSDFKEGSDIVWKGEWKGQPYEDKGIILEVKPYSKLKYSHYSPLTGQPDIPENYHNVTIELSEKGGRTEVLLQQDNNASEEAQKHSEANWTEMLKGLKQVLQGS